MSRLLPLSAALLLSANAFAQAPAASPAPAASGSTPISLEQAMADPDWIGPPVEQAWWAWDGSSAQYTLKREGETIRDTWQVGITGGTPVRVDGAARAQLDGPRPVYDAR